MNRGIRCVTFGLAATISVASPVHAANGVIAGKLTVERPTLVAAGFDWRITGDDNFNAKVEVVYRKMGDREWTTGLPLMRLGGGGEAVGINETPSQHAYVVPNMFSGSIFDLTPNAEYQARFTMSDPDGGKAIETVTFRTRAEPMPSADGKVYHLYPVDWKGPKQEPAFVGSILEAYYMGSSHTDGVKSYPPRVKPGDSILVHAGLYMGDRFHYMNGGPAPGHLAVGNYFDGTYYLTADGTPDRPIAIKAAGDGEVIFDGDGNHILFNMMGGNYNYFEGITVRNTDVAFLLGIKDIAGATGFTLKRSKLYNIGRGVSTEWPGSKDFYIADNEFNGRNNPNFMMGWRDDRWAPFPDFPELLVSEFAVKVYGQGHVMAYNKVTNFHDGIDIDTHGAPDGVIVYNGNADNEIRENFPESVDMYGNDLNNFGDNCLEMDGGGRNIRAWKNRCFNPARQAISVQPGFGGPFYWIRNIVYNTNSALKYLVNSTGILTYNNTIFGEAQPSSAQNMHFRNNLWIGIGTLPTVFALSSPANTNTADYNGYRPNPGAKVSFAWNTPAFEKRLDYGGASVNRAFPTLEAFRAATGQETHGILVDYDSFVKVVPTDQSDPRRIYDSAGYDFRLVERSPAVDAGMVLPNITDGFSGKAPDLGAIELGQPMPHYGPRPQTPRANK